MTFQAEKNGNEILKHGEGDFIGSVEVFQDRALLLSRVLLGRWSRNCYAFNTLGNCIHVHYEVQVSQEIELFTLVELYLEDCLEMDTCC